MEKMMTKGHGMPHSIQLAIAEHGALRVFGASLLALLRAVFAPVEADPTERLSEHLRRDIGLPPRGSPLPEAPMLPVRW